MSQDTIALLVVLAGILARVLLPYVVKAAKAKDWSFDPKYLIPPLCHSMVALIATPLFMATLPPDFVADGWYVLYAMAFGWAGTDVFRNLFKIPEK